MVISYDQFFILSLVACFRLWRVCFWVGMMDLLLRVIFLSVALFFLFGCVPSIFKFLVYLIQQKICNTSI